MHDLTYLVRLRTNIWTYPVSYAGLYHLFPLLSLHPLPISFFGSLTTVLPNLQWLETIVPSWQDCRVIGYFSV